MALKKNSKKVLDIIAAQKQRNAKAAYMQVHPNASPQTAAVNASTLLKKPEAQIYLQEHIKKAQETVVDLMMNSYKDEIRLRSAQDVLDRTHGKARQQIEAISTGITLNIDLTSALLEEPEE